MADAIDYGAHAPAATGSIDYGAHASMDQPEEKSAGTRLWESFVSALPHPIDAIKEWANRPVEVGKAMDAVHELNQLHDQAAKDPANKGKPVNQWKYPNATPDQQSKIDAGLTARLQPAEDTLGIAGPLVSAGGQAQKGDLAGASGTLLGAYAAPAVVGSGLSKVPGIVEAGVKEAQIPGTPQIAGGAAAVAGGGAAILKGHPFEGGAAALYGAEKLRQGLALRKASKVEAAANASAAATKAAEDAAFQQHINEMGANEDSMRSTPTVAQPAQPGPGPTTASGRPLTPDEIAFQLAEKEETPPLEPPPSNPIQDALERARAANAARVAPQPAVTVPPAPEPAIEPTTQTADVPSVTPQAQDLSALSPEDKFQALRKSLIDKGDLPEKGTLGGKPARARFDEGGPSETVKPVKTVIVKPADLVKGEYGTPSAVLKNPKALKAAMEAAGITGEAAQKAYIEGLTKAMAK